MSGSSKLLENSERVVEARLPSQESQPAPREITHENRQARASSLFEQREIEIEIAIEREREREQREREGEREGEAR